MDWTQRLPGNNKERFVISGMGWIGFIGKWQYRRFEKLVYVMYM